jgi:ketosteroid isomerase-like protein
MKLKVLGGWHKRNRLRVVMTPPNGNPVIRSGHTLTILRKDPNGDWKIARDANLLAPETNSS